MDLQQENAQRDDDGAEPGNVARTNTSDALGNLTKETGTGAEAATADHTYSYDLAGHLLVVAAPTTADTFTYDDRGLLLNAAGASGASSFGYNADARMNSRTDAADTTVYTYDANGGLGTTADPLTGTTITDGYNTDSQLTSQTYSTGGNTRTFGYDNLSRLQRATNSPQPPAPPWRRSPTATTPTARPPPRPPPDSPERRPTPTAMTWPAA